MKLILKDDTGVEIRIEGLHFKVWVPSLERTLEKTYDTIHAADVVIGRLRKDPTFLEEWVTSMKIQAVRDGKL